jgi:sugar O-acyltransferase (sialic acid O-acetyltransferase NeuD family)
VKRVVIIGAGGLAREVADVFAACNQVRQDYEIVGFIDESPASHGSELNGLPVLGDLSWFDGVDKSEIWVSTGIGNPASRRKVVSKALKRGLQFCNVIHPTAVVTPFITYGVGVVITAGCILTNQIVIGNHVYLNLDCTVGHDATIDEFCNINPGVHVSGNVHLKVGCDVGTGAVIIQGVSVGEWSVIGAGAVVTTSLPANVTAVGLPARVIKTREERWYDR